MTLHRTPRPAYGVKVTGSLPCWACLAAGPFSRAGPAVPQAPRSHPRGSALQLLFRAPAVLSPSYRPAFRHRSYRPGASAAPAPRSTHPADTRSERRQRQPGPDPPTPQNGAHVRQPSPRRQPSRRQRKPVLAARPHARQLSSVMPRSTGASRDSTACRICHAATEPDLTRQPKPAPPARAPWSDRPGTSSMPIQLLCHPSDCRRPATRRHPPGSHRPPPGPVLGPG